MRLGLSRRKRHTGAFGILLFAALTLTGTLLIILVKLQPAFFDYAGKYANNMANGVVNSAVQSVYKENGYDSLTTVTDSGVKTVETDAAKINILRAKLNQTIQNMLTDKAEETVYVPAGSALGWYFLSGSGFNIPVKIRPLGVVNADLREEFDSAGINQVYHRIYIDVSIEMSYIGLMMSKTETVSTTALVSETVIIGDTPQYYGMGEVAVE